MELGETGVELPVDERSGGGTPGDVAALYLWANLRGAKYRDFSASRREYRAQVRYRAAKALGERELQAQMEAEEAAVAAERAADAAEAAARSQDGGESQAVRTHRLRSAEAATRKAAAQRAEAQRRAEAAARAEEVARREQREMIEAHASAQRQALGYAQAEARRAPAGPRGESALPGEVSDPYTPVNTPVTEDEYSEPVGGLGLSGDGEESGFSAGRERVESEGLDLAQEPVTPLEFGESREAGEGLEDGQFGLGDVGSRGSSSFGSGSDGSGSGPGIRMRSSFDSDYHFDLEPDAARVAPAWLYAASKPTQASPEAAPPAEARASADTQAQRASQAWRETMATQWPALRGVFDRPQAELAVAGPGGTHAPVLLVFSFAGGAGKTSLAAALARALSSRGEKVLLSGTSSQGLLPLYFGGRDLLPGVVRSFSPPEGSGDAPILLASNDLTAYDSQASYDATGADQRRQEALLEEIFRGAQKSNRLVMDLAAGANWLVRRMAAMRPVVLSPLSPDMNSAIGLQAMERFFEGMVDGDGRPLRPFYVLNRFEATHPLHLDVRKALRRQLGDRLLNVAIRRSADVSEALAEGMTVLDYAPESAVSGDYRDVAEWLQTVSPPVAAGFAGMRWSKA
jgi:cellulose synthase operon protein YhjQ